MFSKELRRLRKEKNISIRELERKTGISNSYLSQLENNKRPRPSEEVIAKIAKELGGDAYTQLMMEAGYYNPSDVLDSMFMNKTNKTILKIVVPQFVELKDSNGVIGTKAVSEKDIFDLNSLLSMASDKRLGFDLYYKGVAIPHEKIKELSKIVRALLE